MKKFTALVLALLLAASLCASAFGAGGESSDPAVTKSYLEQIWLPELLESARTMTRDSLRETENSAFRQLAEDAAVRQAAAAKTEAARRQHRIGRMTLKRGDVLYPAPGCKVLVFLGTVTAQADLIDVTAGAPCGGTMETQHLYMQSDEVSGGLIAASDYAEVWVSGLCSLRLSDGMDCGSLAEGLSAMALFRGTDVGFDLNRTATRAEGLVMFLRLLGKEDEALACTDPTPFTDVPENAWYFPYVSYAYRLGLTNGVSPTLFAPGDPINARHYLTFLLRALHYEEGAVFSWDTVLNDAVRLGLFRENEVAFCTDGPFLRSKMVYLSWYSLFCPDASSRLLLVDSLLESGSVTLEQVCGGIVKTRGARVA